MGKNKYQRKNWNALTQSETLWTFLSWPTQWRPCKLCSKLCSLTKRGLHFKIRLWNKYIYSLSAQFILLTWTTVVLTAAWFMLMYSSPHTLTILLSISFTVFTHSLFSHIIYYDRHTMIPNEYQTTLSRDKYVFYLLITELIHYLSQQFSFNQSGFNLK